MVRHPRWACGLLLVTVILGAAGCGAAGCRPATAPPLRIAVSANFYPTALELAGAYQEKSAIRLELIPGSSGKHVAQIRAGAPYDVLLSADTLRPGLLAREGLASQAWIYAEGILVAWSPFGPTPAEARASLGSPQTRVALANPDLAPYGLAARQVLDALESPATRVYGENVSQARQFTEVGSVRTGLVALAQIPPARRSEVWMVPDSLYGRILQAAVILNETEAAQGFLTFMRSNQAAAIIRRAGYRLEADSATVRD
ncbi:MAG: molybdate transport system substrate-binding protein [Rhodothermales bacterium]|jgi:molybdate transport system substrate-binding protein